MKVSNKTDSASSLLPFTERRVIIERKFVFTFCMEVLHKPNKKHTENKKQTVTFTY